MESIHLQHPNFSAIKDAYRSLSKHGQVSLITSSKSLTETINQLEDASFIAISILKFELNSEQVKLRAFKGKQGPCFDTGRTAKYTGSALAALDDDQHLIFENDSLALCEKTAKLYQLEDDQQKHDVDHRRQVQRRLFVDMSFKRHLLISDL